MLMDGFALTGVNSGALAIADNETATANRHSSTLLQNVVTSS